MVSGNEMLILMALAKEREAYGRALIDAVESLPRGRRLTLGALYPTLGRLEEKGLVRGRWGDDSETREGARRRYFSLTAKGLRALTDAHASLSDALGALTLAPSKR